MNTAFAFLMTLKVTDANAGKALFTVIIEEGIISTNLQLNRIKSQIVI